MSALRFPKLHGQEGSRRRRVLSPRLRCQRPRHRRRHRCRGRHAADGRDMNGQALALTLETGIARYWSRSRNALWKRAKPRQFPARRRDAHRLRSGRLVASRESVGPRRNLPHRPAIMLLSDGGAQRRQGDACRRWQQPLFDADQTYRKLVNQSTVPNHSYSLFSNVLPVELTRTREIMMLEWASLRSRPDVREANGPSSSGGVPDPQPAGKTGISLALAAAAPAAGRISACCAHSMRPASKSR